ncbi:helix-turn-helix domain-containing protein [Paramaledivibacter caminithermalis]
MQYKIPPFKGNKDDAIKILGISKKTLYNKIEKYCIEI